MAKAGLNAAAIEPGGAGEAVPPGYILLHERGVLDERAAALEANLRECRLCPRSCGVDRTSGKKGFCGVGSRPKIAAVNIHHWEEPPISGSRGSGAIFFSGCTLKCVFCQNYPISQMGVGREYTAGELASAMLRLQDRGAHNINLVTSTHQMASVLRALTLAAPRGLSLPLVYNSSGYESLETLRLLDGIVDIYLPDVKYSDPLVSRRLSKAGNYVSHNRAALLEMWRQAGPLRLDAEGIARKGMMVRHLVLPEDLSGTAASFRFLAEKIGPDLWVSLMSQYFPAHGATAAPPLDRKISGLEYEDALDAVAGFGFRNGFSQMLEGEGGEQMDRE